MPTRTQIFQVSTLYGAATLAAALDAGRFGPGQDSHRVLLVSNNAAIPETALRLEEMRGYGDIAARFDSVVDWNDAISPHHPSGWGPRSRRPSSGSAPSGSPGASTRKGPSTSPSSPSRSTRPARWPRSSPRAPCTSTRTA